MAETKQFTAHGETEAEAKAKADLERIADAVECVFPSLISLAVIGAFGRGEGAIVQTAGGPQPWNDYDLLLVTPTREGWERLPDTSKAIISELRLPGLDIVPFLPAELVEKASAMLVSDARKGHVVLRGDTELFKVIPAISVPEEEALALLLNRMICLLESPPEELTGKRPDALFHAAQVSKTVFAVVDTFLVRTDKYVTRYREKVTCFLTLPDISEELRQAAQEALSFRLDPRPRDWDSTMWFLARDELLTQVGILLGLGHGAPAASSARVLWRRRLPSLRQIIRGLMNGRRPITKCRAVECAELLVLGAASPSLTGRELDLLIKANGFMDKADKVAVPSSCWADGAKRAVRLWFAICHG